MNLLPTNLNFFISNLFLKGLIKTRQIKALEDVIYKQNKTIKKLSKYQKEVILNRGFIDHSPFAILLTDKNKKIIYANKAWEKLSGYKLRSVINKTPNFLTSDKSRKIMKAGVNELIRSGKPFVSNEVVNINKNGNEFFVNTAIFEVKSGNREKLYFQILDDITESKQNQDAINILNRKISHIIASISDGFISLDNNWKCIYINKHAESILQTKKEKLFGKNIWKVLPWLKKSELYIVLNEVINEKIVKILDIKLYKQKWYQVRMYPANDGVSIYLYDITLQKELELQQNDFIGIASHEIKTPVTSIKAYSQLISKRVEQKKDKDLIGFINKLNEQINRLQQLVQDLLDTHRFQEGRAQINKENFSLTQLMIKIIEECENLSDKHKITFNKKVEYKVYADKEKIAQVITNLLTNAVKYSPNGGIVKVAVRRGDKEIIVSVKDSGLGVPSEMHEKIFHKFSRIINREIHISGLGLGLYISHQIINLHKGRIWVESPTFKRVNKDGVKIEKGSIFYFSLPANKSNGNSEKQINVIKNLKKRKP